MFPVDKKGERFHDPSSPKIAVYSAHPTSKPTVKLSEVKPAPGSLMRSRIKLLQDQKKMPTGGWTTSTIHTPSSQNYLASTLPGGPLVAPSGNEHSAGTAAHVVAPLRSREENLADQVKVLEAQVSQYKDVLQQTNNNENYYGAHGNHAGQFPATAQPPQPGPYPPQPLGYQGPPHPYSAHAQPKGPLPTAPGPHQATLGYPHGSRHYPVTTEQPYVGAEAQFSKLGNAPNRVSVKGNHNVPPHIPAVETHNTALLEQLQHQQRVADSDALRLQSELAQREAHRSQIEQELLQLRKQAAESQAQATKSRMELDDLLARRGLEECNNNEILAKSENMKQRYDFVCEELDRTKKELQMERNIPRYQPLSATSAGLGYGGDFGALGPSNDFSSTALACENNSLKAQVTQLLETLQQRDAHADSLMKSNATLLDENSKLATDIRHEQHNHLIALSTTESHKVLLSDAQSEVEYLRLLTSEQKATIDRITRDHEERFERIKTEMEARQVRELQAQHATEGAKALHVEAARVHKALLAEQAINANLREEIGTLRRSLQEEQTRNQQQAARYDALQRNVQDTDASFAQQTSTLEKLLGQWQQQQARQASEERGQIQQATEILNTLKALEMPHKNGHLEPPLRSSLVPTEDTAQHTQVPRPVASSMQTVNVSGVIHVASMGSTAASTSAPQAKPIPVAHEQSLQDEVRSLLVTEQQYRRDAEASRHEALAALAMHNKSLETPSI